MVKILIVDDEPAIRQLVRRYAELEDYQVSEAANGFEAVECATTRTRRQERQIDFGTGDRR